MVIQLFVLVGHVSAALFTVSGTSVCNAIVYRPNDDIMLVGCQQSFISKPINLVAANGSTVGYLDYALQPQYVQSLSVSAAGDVYWCGQTQYQQPGFVNYGNGEIIAGKFLYNGTRSWYYELGSLGQDSAQAGTYSEAGNAYIVTGFAGGSIQAELYYGGTTDVVVIKFNSSDPSKFTVNMFGSAVLDEGYALVSDTNYVYVSSMVNNNFQVTRHFLSDLTTNVNKLVGPTSLYEVQSLGLYNGFLYAAVKVYSTKQYCSFWKFDGQLFTLNTTQLQSSASVTHCVNIQFDTQVGKSFVVPQGGSNWISIVDMLTFNSSVFDDLIYTAYRSAYNQVSGQLWVAGSSALGNGQYAIHQVFDKSPGAVQTTSSLRSSTSRTTSSIRTSTVQPSSATSMLTGNTLAVPTLTTTTVPSSSLDSQKQETTSIVNDGSLIALPSLLLTLNPSSNLNNQQVTTVVSLRQVNGSLQDIFISNLIVIIAVLAGFVVLIGLITVLCCYCSRKKRKSAINQKSDATSTTSYMEQSIPMGTDTTMMRGNTSILGRTIPITQEYTEVKSSPVKATVTQYTDDTLASLKAPLPTQGGYDPYLE